MQRRIIYILAALLVIILVVVSVAFSWLWSGPRCELTATTTAITNDASGIRYATFQVTNIGPSRTLVFSDYFFEIRDGKWRSEIIPPRAIFGGTNMLGHLPPGKHWLDSGETFSVTLALPFDDRDWRFRLIYKPLYPKWTDPVYHCLFKIGIGRFMPEWPEHEIFASSDGEK
jgi:hypothetical protein